METTCCIAGGGPAGMMLGWLLARAGVDVIVLEKHADFFRDFRGDTIHASTLEILSELGVLDEFLKLPHTEVSSLGVEIAGERVPGPDLTHLHTRCKFIAMMPQWDFLDFVKRQASALPTFRLLMHAAVTGLSPTGVTLGDGRQIRARLVVGCDGRHSTVRALSQMPVHDLGAPIDVLWLRIPRRPSDGAQVFAVIDDHHFIVMLDRGDYWQCAVLVEKGAAEAVKALGIEAFRADFARAVPVMADRVASIASWDDVKLLTVVVDRLERWASGNVLCIGDAAHAMSPVGGVGINLAIQDAVATANLLWRPLRDGTPLDLDAVQARREPATIKTQRLQLLAHDHVLAKIVQGRAHRTLRIARWVLKLGGPLRRYVARAVAVGYTPEHVESPDAGKRNVASAPPPGLGATIGSRSSPTK